MRSIEAETVRASYDALDAALDQIHSLPFDALGAADHLDGLARMERARRRMPVAEHRMLNHLGEHATCEEIGGRLPQVLANRLRITKTEAARRIADAQVLGPRSTLTGEPLAPMWATAAAAQQAGQIGTGHISEIRRFFKQLPDWVDEPTRERAERDLVKVAREYRPDELRRAAGVIDNGINPDGNFTDEDRARLRGITIGRQGEDGMSPISGYLTPECRAGLNAVMSKWAAPGMFNPADRSPTVDGSPSEEAITADQRSRGQRNHDALNAMCRSVLASGELGSHHGLPVSIVVTTTLQELHRGAGRAYTGGNTWLPMRDLMRMASHAWHYLAVFSEHTNMALYLGRTKRIASPGQRIVLHALDRGCTHPGCTVPANLCEVLHIEDWAHGGPTDIDKLTLGCGPDHKRQDNGWAIRKRPEGTTEWIPPPGQGTPGINNYFHPQRYLRAAQEDDDEDKD